jgi:adenylate cyclase
MDIFRRAILTSLVTALVGGVLVLSALGPVLEQGTGLAWLFSLRGPVSPPESVIVVRIDTDSAVRLEQPTKLRDWDRSLHADLVRKLSERGAAAIVFDVFFDESQSQIDDHEFAQEIRRAQRVILVQQVQRDQVGELMLDRVINPAPVLAAEVLGLAPFPLPKVRNRFGQFWAFYSGVRYSSTLPVVALQAYVVQTYGYQNLVDLLKESGFKRAEELPPVMTDSNDLRMMMGMLRADFKLVPQLFSNFTSRLQQYNSPNWINAFREKRAVGVSEYIQRRGQLLPEFLWTT